MEDIVFSIDDEGNMAVITSERIKEDIKLGLRCPICEEFTNYYEWAKPKVALLIVG